jgi:hypothetical protein
MNVDQVQEAASRILPEALASKVLFLSLNIKSLHINMESLQSLQHCCQHHLL